MHYKSTANIPHKDESTTYKFCPNGAAQPVSNSSAKLISSYSDDTLNEVSYTFADYAHATVRTYADKEYIELDWTVGPLPLIDGAGHESIIRFESDLNNGKDFYTDSNGRQVIKRTYHTHQHECGDNQIPGNWYPIVTKAFIQDKQSKVQLSILNDRTQGGSSLGNGQFELMIHRRLSKNGLDEKGPDGKGLVVRGKLYIYLKPIDESMQLIRDHAQRY